MLSGDFLVDLHALSSVAWPGIRAAQALHVLLHDHGLVDLNTCNNAYGLQLPVEGDRNCSIIMYVNILSCIKLSAIFIPCCPCIFLKSYGTKDFENDCRWFSNVCLLTDNKKPF